MIKNPPVMQETCVQSLNRDDPLEKNFTDRGAWQAIVHRVTKGQV